MATIQDEKDDLIILTDDMETSSTDELVINLETEDASSDNNEEVILNFDNEDMETSKTSTIQSSTDSDIILTEDNSSDDIFSIDTQLDNEDILDTSEAFEAKEDTVENIKEEETSEEVFDFGSLETEDATPEPKIEETTDIQEDKNDSTESELNFDMDISDTTVDESTKIEEPKTTDLTNIGSMDDILDDTINKLSQRQDIIHSQEEEQKLAISHLEEEIKQLEKEKEEALLKKQELEKEDKKIKTNITQLDKMKAAAEVAANNKK